MTMNIFTEGAKLGTREDVEKNGSTHDCELSTGQHSPGWAVLLEDYEAAETDTGPWFACGIAAIFESTCKRARAAIAKALGGGT